MAQALRLIIVCSTIREQAKLKRKSLGRSVSGQRRSPATHEWKVLYYYHLFIAIRECGSTLYVGVAHTVPFTQYIVFTAFSPNWLPEGSILRYTPARRSRFQVQDNFPVIVSTRKVAEQRSRKTALSYI